MDTIDELGHALGFKVSPAFKRNMQRSIVVRGRIFRLQQVCFWMRWPILKVVYGFWESIFGEGIIATCKPRWGIMTFAFLNDGFKPTIWHTWWGITHDYPDPYVGIYPKGAPKSKAQAKEWSKT